MLVHQRVSNNFQTTMVKSNRETPFDSFDGSIHFPSVLTWTNGATKWKDWSNPMIFYPDYYYYQIIIIIIIIMPRSLVKSCLKISPIRGQIFSRFHHISPISPLARLHLLPVPSSMHRGLRAFHWLVVRCPSCHVSTKGSRRVEAPTGPPAAWHRRRKPKEVNSLKFRRWNTQLWPFTSYNWIYVGLYIL